MGLEKLLYLQGIGDGFSDSYGRFCPTSAGTRKQILSAMCGPIPEEASELWIERRIHQLDAKPWQQLLPSFQWCYLDSLGLRFRLEAQSLPSKALQLTLTSELGEEFVVSFSAADCPVRGDYRIGERCYLELELKLDEVSGNCGIAPGLGYHRVSLSIIEREGDDRLLAAGTLMVAPRQSFQGVLQKNTARQNEPHRRPWGVSVQLFSLWQEDTPGPEAMGDFGALLKLITQLAPKGLDFILLNPLHALALTEDASPSPYSPIDRRRLHPLYISPPLCAEGTAPICDAESFAEQTAFSPWLDYAAVSRDKCARLKAMWLRFNALPKDASRRLGYEGFMRREGLALQHYAREQASFATGDWPTDANFYLYLQFVAEEQLALCQSRAIEAGMSIGLIRDLAVGTVGSGTEVSQHQSQFCQGASIGAPPDAFAPQGQNWGLTPLDPVGLKQADFSHFIELLRTNMRHCGAIRIDHVMSLFRLWWWPVGAENQIETAVETESGEPEGAYVYYPFDTLRAILLLESQRARCLVIGEDLGLVPAQIVAPLKLGGLYSNELFYFCREQQDFPDFGGFRPPNDYKPNAIMMLSNHDVAPLKAWLEEEDLRLRRELGLLGAEQYARESEDRRRDIQALEVWLSQFYPFENKLKVSLEPNSVTYTHNLIHNLAVTVASGRSALFSLPLTDLLGDKVAVNIPGTSAEYPNWRRRYSLAVERLNDSELLQNLLRDIRRVREQSCSAEPERLRAQSTGDADETANRRQ